MRKNSRDEARKGKFSSDIALAHKVLAATAAFGVIGNPLAVTASTVIKADAPNTNLIQNGVGHIYADKMNGDIAVNHFKDFNLTPGDIANLYFKTENSSWAGNLVNFVDSRINVAGTVNAVKENKIGGNLFFLSSSGMAVTSGGVINAGSLTVLTPTDDVMKSFENGENINKIVESPAEIALNSSGTITIEGTVNTAGNIRMYGGKKVTVGAGGLLQTAAEQPSDGTNVRANIFSSTVNIGDNKSLNWDLEAKDVGNGDIVLSAKNTESGGSASVDVIGKLYGHDVTVSAVSDVSYAEEEDSGNGNLLGDGISWGNIIGDSVGTINPVGIDIADASGSASVTVGKDAEIHAANDVSIAAESTVSIEAGAAPGESASNQYGIAGVIVANAKNHASVEMGGKVNAGKNADIHANAETSITGKASDKAESDEGSKAGGESSGQTDTEALTHTAVAVVNNDTSAEVTISGEAGNRASIKAEGDLSVQANVKNSLDISAEVEASGDAALATAVAVVDSKGSASADVRNADITGENVTISAENTVDGNSITVNNGIGQSEESGEEGGNESGQDTGSSSAADKGKEVASAIMSGDSLSDVISDNLTEKISEAIGGAADGGQTQSGIVKKLGSLFDLGASVAVVKETNTANVNVDSSSITASGTATEKSPDLGKVDIHANTVVDDTAMFVTGAANKQTESAKKENGTGGNTGSGTGKAAGSGSTNIIADAAVLVSGMDNQASVSVNNATVIGDAVDIASKTQMQYRLRGMVDDLKSSVNDLITALGSSWTDGNDAASAIKDLLNDVDAYLKDGESDMSPEGIASFAGSLEDKITSVKDKVTSLAGDIKDAKEAAESIKKNLEAFKDPGNYINYSVHTESSDQLEGETNSKAGSGFALGIAGSVNVTNVNNAAATAVGGDTAIHASGAASVVSDAQTETVSVTGNATSVLGSSSAKNNTGKTPAAAAGGSQNAKSTSIGVGGSVAVQDITGTSAVVMGGGVSVLGRGTDDAADSISIAANTVMGQQGIVYGSGEAGTAGIEGMVNLMNGGSDSVVQIEDGASLKGGEVSIRGDNSTFITAVAGGATLGSNATAASVGAGLTMMNYDVNNMVVIGDGKADDNAGETEKAEAKKQADGAALAKNLLEAAGGTISNAENKGEQTFVAAKAFDVKAETKGIINSVAVEAAANTKNQNKTSQKGALGSLNEVNGGSTGSKADELLGEEGKVNKNLNESDEQAVSQEINDAASVGDKTVSQDAAKGDSSSGEGSDSGQGSGKAAASSGTSVHGPISNSSSTASSVNVAGAGSVAINMLGGETGAFVDHVNIQMPASQGQKDAAEAGKVDVGASDSLFAGAWAGAAAVNWFTKSGKGTGTGTDTGTGTGTNTGTDAGTVTKTGTETGSGGSTTVSIGGAAGVSVTDRGVSSVISHSDITGAESITNKAEKSGAEIAAGLGLSVAKGSGTNVAVSAAVSYNEADSDIHALMIGNQVNEETGNTDGTAVTNTAYNSDLQITGGIAVSATSGGKTGVGVDGTVVISDLDNDLQSGIIGGSYNRISDMDIDAAVATTQINAAAAAAVSTDTRSFGFTGAVSYNKINNNNSAYIDGAEITASGDVNVKAGDTEKGSSDYADYMENRGWDTTGKTDAKGDGIADKGATFVIADKKSDDETNETGSFTGMREDGGSTIVNVAASAAVSNGTAAGGAAVNISDVDNTMHAGITGATITAGRVTGQADTNTRIVSVAAGVGVSGGNFGGAGSVSWDTLRNNNTVLIDRSTIKAGSVAGNALNKAQIVNVAGQVSASSKAGTGLALAYNKMDNTTGVYVQEGNLASGNIALDAESASEITAITAGVSGAGTVAVNGTVAINRGTNSTEAVLGNDEQTVVISDAKDISVKASDESKNNTVAGGITGAGTAAVGGGAAYSDIGGSSGDADSAAQQVRAEINHAEITTKDAGTISTEAKDASKLLTIAAGVGASGTVAVQGASATALINKNVSASMTGTSIDDGKESGTQASKSKVIVSAESDSDITTSADVIGASGSVALGAGVAVNRIIQQTNASVNGGAMRIGNLDIRADGTPSIRNIGIGIAAGTTAGITGSVAVNMIQNDVTAHIGQAADITADGSVGVIASSDEQIENYAGSASVSGTGAGVGVSVSVNQINGITEATVGGENEETTKVTALGNGEGIASDTVIEDSEIHDTLISNDTVQMGSHITRKNETRKGLVVDASSTRDLKSFLINAGVAGEGAAVAGTVNVNQIQGATSAGILNTVVNGDAAETSPAGNVYVNAGDYTNSSGFVGTAGINGIGASVGLGSDTNSVRREVSAVIDDSTVKADTLEVDADSKQGISSFAVGESMSGIGAGVAGVVTVTELGSETRAALTDTDVSAGTVSVSASHTGIVHAGNVSAGAAGIGAGAGLSIGVLQDNSVTETTVGSVDDKDPSKIDASGDVTIAAKNTTKTSPTISATGAAAAGAGIAGATSVNNLNSKVKTNISKAAVTAGGNISGSAKNTFDVDAYIGSQAGGVGGAGAGVTVNTIDSMVQTNVAGSTLKANGSVNLTAEEERNIEQLATNAVVGSIAAGANIAVTTVGQEISDEDTKNKIGEVNKNGSAANGLLGGASGALETAGIDENSVKLNDQIAGVGGNKNAQITVNITDSAVDAGKNIKAAATETDNIQMTLGSGAAGAAALNAGVGILNVHRNVGVNVTGGSMEAGAIDINTDITGTSSLEVYQGTGGLFAGNAAVGQVSTSGVSQIAVEEASLKGDNVAVEAKDTGTTEIQAIAVSAGAVAVGALAAESKNDSDVSVSLKETDIEAENKISVRSEKANKITAEAVNIVGGAIGGAGMGATVTDMGSSKITLNQTKLKAAAEMGIDAETRSTLAANIRSASGGWLASGSVSVAKINAGTAKDRLSTLVEMKGTNTLESADIDVSALTDVTQNVTMEALAISGYKSAQGNVTETGTYADAEITQEGNDTFKGAADNSTADVQFKADNKVSQSVDTKGISAAGLFATGTNISTTTNDLRTNIALSGSSSDSRIKDFEANAGSYAEVSNTVNGDGGAIADMSPYAAKANNTYNADTDVTIGGNWNAEGSFTAQALNGMDINLLSEATRAAVVGGSGTWLANTINNAANITIEKAAITADKEQNYTAQNKVDYTGEIDGSGYGGINVNATDYKDDLDFTAGVDVRDSTLTGDGDKGSITASAGTTGTVSSKNSLKSAGVVPVALAFSEHNVDYGNSVNIENSTLTTDKRDQDITLSTFDDTKVTLETIADTQGGVVGAASAEASNTMNRSNKINIDKSSQIHSTNDINLYAGADTNGLSSSLDLQVLADAYNKTGIPLVTAPKVKNTMTQANQIFIGGQAESVRHINLSASKGTTTVTKSAQEYKTWTGTGGKGNVASTVLGDSLDDETEDNYVEVAGQATAGIHNKLDLTIEGEITVPGKGEDVDLSKITVSVGEGEEWFSADDVKRGTTYIENNLMARYTEVMQLMSQYAEGTSEYKSYQTELTSLLQEMLQMGMAAKDKNGNITPARGIEVPAVSLPDIVVSGGNINIDTDSLKGSGNLTAKGAPQVNITNRSDAYLIVNDVAIQDAGGQIKMNGSSLSADTLGNEMSSSQIIADGVTGGDSLIAISGTSAKKNGMQADIGVFGNVSNTSGDIEISNSNYNLNILGNISGRDVSLVAENGSVTQTSTEGFINIGGDPVTKYQFSETVAKAVQEYIYDQFVHNPAYTIPEFKNYDDYVNWIKKNIVTSGKYGITEADLIWKEDDPADPGNKIVAGGNVYINGLNVNIGGLVQSGYGKYSATLDSSAKAKIEALDKAWKDNKGTLSDSQVMGDDTYLINRGGQVYNKETGVYDYEIRVYYNPSTGELLTDSVSVSGGKIYITGNISSTGNGKIMAMDGAADIAVDTSGVDRNVKVNTITNNDISGLISITDKNKTDANGHYLVTEYRNGQQRSYYSGVGSDSDWKNVTGNMTYNPEEGLQYQWTSGVSGEVTTKYQYSEKFLAWGLLDYGNSGTFVAGLQSSGKMPQGTTVSSGTATGKENGVVITKGDSGKDFSITGSYTNNTAETYGPIAPDMEYDGFWGKVFGYGTTTYTWTGTKGTSSSTTTSVAADKQIQIGFIGSGNGSGNISVTSGGDMMLAGNISNAVVVDGNGLTAGKGNISLTSGGSVTGGGVINSDSVKISAAGDINVNHSAVGSNATVDLASDGGDIHFTSSQGDLSVIQASAGGMGLITAETGNVYLEAEGSILDAHSSGDYAVKGQRIDLISRNGTIGTEANALDILGGSELYSADSMASSVNASAKGDIILTQTEGNMRLGTIESADGNAVLTVNNGSFIDAHPEEKSSSSTAQDKIDLWLNSGLISKDDDAGSSSKAAEEAKTERLGALENRLEALASESENTDSKHTVAEYKEAADAFYKNEDMQAAKAAYMEAVENAGGDKDKINDAYNDYQEAQSTYFESKGFSTDEQSAIINYAEVANSDNYGWSKNELLYAVQDTILNAKPGDVQTVETPNVSAKNITLNAANGGIGIDGDAKEIRYDMLNDVENLKIMANAKAGDLTWGDESVTVRQQQAITVQAKGADSKINVNGRDNVYLAGVKDTKLDINDIDTAGNIKLQGDLGIDVDSLKGNNLTIAGGSGDIMSSHNDEGYIHTELQGSIDANAAGSIFFESVNNTDLKILTVAAGGVVGLKAAQNILMENVTGSMVQGRINAAEVNFTANGNIGSSGDDQAVRILDNGAVINAEAGGDVYLSGESGEGSADSLIIGTVKGKSFTITSVSDVSLGCADNPDTEGTEAVSGSITTTDGDASVSAENVNLSDGSVNTVNHDFNVIARAGNITQSENAAGITANQVNLSSTGSQLLKSKNNEIGSVSVKGLTNDSLTGNVEIHSKADDFAVQFGDRTADGSASGITVHNGGIALYHEGENAVTMTVTGSAATVKEEGSEADADIVMTGAGQLTNKGTLNSAGNVAVTAEGSIHQAGDITAQDHASFTVVGDSGDIVLGGNVTATTGAVDAETESGNIEANGSVTAGTDIAFTSTNGSITVGNTKDAVITAGSNAAFTTGSGAITVTGSTAAGDNFTADTGNGDISLSGNVKAEKGNVKAETGAGTITVAGDVTAQSNASFKVTETSGDIHLGGSVTAVTGNINAETKSGVITVGGTGNSIAKAGTDITFISGSGAITVTGSAAAGNDFTAETEDGDISLGGNITADSGDVSADTRSGAITVDGTVAAGMNIAFTSGKGAITVNGAAAAGQNVTAKTEEGSIYFGGNVTAKSGDVSADTHSGAITVDGAAAAGTDIAFTSGKGAITVTGSAAAGNDFTADTESGDISLGGDVKAEIGHVMAKIGSGSIQASGAIASGRNTELHVGKEAENQGNITVGGKIVSGEDVIADTENGDITFIGTVEANGKNGNDGEIIGGNIKAAVAGEGTITVRNDLTAEKNIELAANRGDIFFEGTEEGRKIAVTSENGDIAFSVSGAGSIRDGSSKGDSGDRAVIAAKKGNVTISNEGTDEDGIVANGEGSDIDLYEVYAKNSAKFSTAEGDLHLVNVSGNLVAVVVKKDGYHMEAENLEAASAIQIAGSNMDLDHITQREDGDGFLAITPDGTAPDEAIDDLTIGDIKTTYGVRVDHLWARTSAIHVSSGALHLDKLYIEDKGTFSTGAMSTDVFGSAPVFDDSKNSVYWIDTAQNRPENNLADWQSEGSGAQWMYLHFDADSPTQMSNGNLLHLNKDYYVYSQRHSMADWMNIFGNDDFYTFYDRYHVPALSYPSRYGLIEGSGQNAENADSSEIIIE